MIKCKLTGTTQNMKYSNIYSFSLSKICYKNIKKYMYLQIKNNQNFQFQKIFSTKVFNCCRHIYNKNNARVRARSASCNSKGMSRL